MPQAVAIPCGNSRGKPFARPAAFSSNYQQLIFRPLHFHTTTARLIAPLMPMGCIMSELRKRRSNLPTMFVGAFALAAIATAMPALPAASADRAFPFPSQAVKDAQALLDATNNRWQ